MMIAECDADASIRSSTSKSAVPGQSDKVLTLYPITVQHVPKEKKPASLETGLSDRCLLIRGTALRYSAPAFAGFRANGAGLQPESGEHVHG